MTATTGRGSRTRGREDAEGDADLPPDDETAALAAVQAAAVETRSLLPSAPATTPPLRQRTRLPSARRKSALATRAPHNPVLDAVAQLHGIEVIGSTR